MGRSTSRFNLKAACSVLLPLVAFTAFVLPLAFGQSLDGIPSQGVSGRISLRVVDTTRGYVAIQLPGKAGFADAQIKCICNVGELAKTTTADLTIDLGALDYTPFTGMYRPWAEVPVWYVEPSGAISIDMDSNGFKEIYGHYVDFQSETPGDARIFEYTGSGFLERYKYPNPWTWPMAAADFRGDGLLQVLCRKESLEVYQGHRTMISSFALLESPVSGGFATQQRSIYPVGGGARHLKIYDIDGDGRPEVIYKMNGLRVGWPGDSHPGYYVEHYEDSLKNFRLMGATKPTPEDVGDIAVGDFDGNGHGKFAFGDMAGNAFVVEHMGGDAFSVGQFATLPIKNAYLACFSHDLDGNGKPELWLGGDMYVNGMGLTRLFAFEAQAHGVYSLAYTIDLSGIFSFYADNLQAADADGDGKEELLLCIDQHVLIFKSTGVHGYALWYAWENPLAQAGENSVIYAASLEDIDADGRPELKIGMDQVRADNIAIRYFTRFYRFAGSTNGIEPPKEKIPRQLRLEQNYPNPFNGTTTITYHLAGRTEVSITIYNIIGKEVRSLLHHEMAPGEHHLIWDACGEGGAELPSGVYFVRLWAKGVTQTVKAVLLK